MISAMTVAGAVRVRRARGSSRKGMMWYLQVYDIAMDEVYQVRISDETHRKLDQSAVEVSPPEWLGEVSPTEWPGIPLKSQLRSEWGLPESEWTPVD
jgi:hypothetical protein